MNYTIKTESQLQTMRKAGKILSKTLKLIEKNVRVGVSTMELNEIAYNYIISCGAKPAFLNYQGFKYTICASLNSEVVHGFPNTEPLQEGDIISIDAGVEYGGFNADAARTFPVGKISDQLAKLIEVTKQCFYEGLKNIKAGSRVGHISNAIQKYAEGNGFSVVRELVGHGIGKKLHEDPMVPNFGAYNSGMTLKENMTIAVEPMINLGKKEVFIKHNGWTIATADHLPSAHYENTIIIKADGYEIIT